MIGLRARARILPLLWIDTMGEKRISPCLVLNSIPKFYYAKRRFSITSKYRQMHGVLNVDEIKN
jgi:hypothetical protein